MSAHPARPASCPCAFALFACVWCAGCTATAPKSAEIDGSGVSNLPDSQTVACGTAAMLDRYIAGSGTAQIEVTDGAGRSIYDQPADVTGELNDQVQLTGTAGTWTLTVDGELSGQYDITLQCL
jgi:hypothetical protein